MNVWFFNKKTVVALHIFFCALLFRNKNDKRCLYRNEVFSTLVSLHGIYLGSPNRVEYLYSIKNYDSLISDYFRNVK